MIAGIEGVIEGVNPDSVLVKVSGVTLLVYTPGSTLGRLGRPGDRARLYTHVYWKEEATALYGFTSPQELELFKMLIGVTGIGPRSALSMLSSLTPDELATAILTENADLITQSPGIGKKTASRLILELKGKLEKGWQGMVGASTARDNSEVIAALVGLGYSTADATRAAGASSASSDAGLEERIRLALQHLGRQ